MFANVANLTSDSMETPSCATEHDCICSLVGQPVRKTPDGFDAATAPRTSLVNNINGQATAGKTGNSALGVLALCHSVKFYNMH